MYEDQIHHIKPVIDESSITGNVIDDPLNGEEESNKCSITLENAGDSSDEEVDQAKEPVIDSMEVNVNNSSPEYIISDDENEDVEGEEGSNHNADSTDDETEPYPGKSLSGW